MTGRRTLRDWNNAGVSQRLHEVLLAELCVAGKQQRSLLSSRQSLEG
jgi:hypothetical protein